MDKNSLSVSFWAEWETKASVERDPTLPTSLVVAHRGVRMNVNKSGPADKAYVDFQNTFDKALH